MVRIYHSVKSFNFEKYILAENLCVPKKKMIEINFALRIIQVFYKFRLKSVPLKCTQKINTKLVYR